MKCALGLLLVAAASSALAGAPSEELIVTGPGERTELAFADGASLAIGPRTRLSVDRTSPEPMIHVREGVVRFVGGTTSTTTPAVIATPASTLTVRDGTVVANVTADSTVAILLGGGEMKVVAGGETRRVTRPGWQVATQAGRAPGAAVPTPTGGEISVATAPGR